MDFVIVIKNFPLPPSENMSYPTVMVRGRPIRVSSRELTRFKNNVTGWALQNPHQLKNAKWHAQEAIRQGLMLEITTRFGFLGSRLWTKAREPKKLDASNRIKAVHDALSNILGIDDRLFWAGSFEKFEVDTPAEECCIVEIKALTPRRSQDLFTSSQRLADKKE